MINLYQYYCARGFIEPGDVVVDAACRDGNGTDLFSKIAKKVVGMDRDREVIKYAMEHHKKDNNYFICANLDQEPTLPSCDVFVSIQTIEHLRYPESFIAKIKDATRKKIFIVTTKGIDFTDDKWECMGISNLGDLFLKVYYRK